MLKKYNMTHTNMTLTPDTIFARSTQWQVWLDVEATLARIQGDIGMIPSWAAAKITAAARLDVIGHDALEDDIARTKAPVLSLTRLLGNAAGDAGDYVHWGATTQNVMQTARILLMRQADCAIRKELALAARTLGKLARDEANTMMIGRTNRQNALPITFGFKVASWITELDRTEARMSDAARRLFVLPFGGAIGAMQSFGDQGRELNKRLAAELELAEMLLPGRAVNDVFAEYLLQLSMLGMCIERVMTEAYTLIGQDYGELGERLDDGAIGSSTMPQKVNPKYVVPVAAQSTQLRGCAATALETGRTSHEGDPLSNQILYAVLDQAVPLAWRACSGFAEALSRLTVNRDVMAQNLASVGTSVCAEHLMMKLAPLVGRGRAHDIVHHALETGGPDALFTDVNITTHLSESQIKTALDPSHYLGYSVEIANRAATLAGDIATRLQARAN
ncbi:lyase family protein [Candidatus Puniceispirillum sp.]|nr:lyase family protein [Candidatus Puniceispirillum sp.]